MEQAVFKDQLAGLPPDLQDVLRARIEELVLRVANQSNWMMQRPDSMRQYTSEEISAAFGAIFDLAQRLKR